MKFVRYTQSGSPPAWGVLRGDTVHSLSAHPAGEPTYGDIGTDGYRERVRGAVERGGLPTVAAADVDLLAPVPEPGKIVSVGLNYRDHAEEQGADVPDRPLLFSKAPTSVTNPGDPVVIPGNEDRVDYEAELGVVIGATASGVTEADARAYVAGYTAINDVSGRSAQFDDTQWFRGKSFDTFCPMGPAIRAGDGFDPNAVDVACRVNGETRQDSNTEGFLFDVDEVVAAISRDITLRPGDVIATGTPAGVGVFSDPPELLADGDTVEVEIEGIGTLTNPVRE